MNGSRTKPNEPKSCEELNLVFYKQYLSSENCRLLKWISDKNDIAMYDRLIKRQVAVEAQLTILTHEERLEWAETLTLKYRQLHNSCTNKLTDELIATLFVLVHCSKTFKSINIP